MIKSFFDERDGATMNAVRQPIADASRSFVHDRSTFRSIANSSTIRLVLGLPPIVGAACVLPVSLVSFQAGALCLSFVLGWTVLVGPCGCAHVGALNSAACRRSNPVHWLATILAYTLGGVFSGGIVGVMLGWFGSPWFNLAQWWPLLLLVAVLCLVRETGLIHLPLLEFRRQTHWKWFPHKPLPLNSLMWGLDVGLTFATWLTFSGAWLLAALVIITGNPLFGAATFAIYWLGRAAPHWIEPVLVRDPAMAVPFIGQVLGLHNLMRWIHAFGLAMFAVTLLLQYVGVR